jgi:hypothetical protein
MAFNASTDFNLDAAMASNVSPSVAYSTNLSASTTPKSIPTIRYPYKKITDSDDYLQIKVVKYQPPGIGSGTDNLSFRTSTQALQNNIKTPESIILLPIPQNVQDQNAVGWGESKLNAFQLAGAEAIGGVLTDKNFVEGLRKSGGQFLNKIMAAGVSGNLQNQLNSAFTSAAMQSLGSNATTEDLVSRTTGQVLNANQELLFNGVSLREFSFEYDLAPRDGNEAKEIKKLIVTLKKAMAPRTSADNSPGSGLFISAPRVFQLEYRSGNKKHPFLHSFKPMAMKGMAVNYTGSGNYSVYGDSTPVHMKLTMNFQELNPIYFEDYSDSDIGVGY